MESAHFQQKQEAFDWKARVRNEISRARKLFDELEKFFHEADEEIGNNPNDPPAPTRRRRRGERERLGRLPGLDRLMFLLPCVFDRLEEDIDQGRVFLPSGGDGGNAHQLLDGLEAIERVLKGVLAWYIHDDVDQALQLINAALKNVGKHSKKKETASNGRFLRDLVRVAPDLQILRGMFEDFRENRRRRPAHPEIDESWSVKRWLDYYREQARLEEPIIAVIDAEGLSEESLEKGMKMMIAESERLDRHKEEFVERYRLMRNRDVAFDPDKPELFLDLPAIPDIEDSEDDDAKVQTVDLHYEKDEPPSPWASSLPELKSWDSIVKETNFADDSELAHPEFENDLVYRMLKPFVNNLISCLKKEYLEAIQKVGGETYPMRSPLEHYLILLAFKAQARISSCGVWVDEVGHHSPRHGAYMFAMECLERIAEALEKLAPERLHHLVREARDIRNRIKKLL